MKRLMFAFLISGFFTQSLAEMYKWTDEEGNVQYTQTPPPAGVQSKTMTGIPTNSISGSQPPPPTENAEPSQVSNAEPSQVSKEACLKIQEKLKILKSGTMVIPDKKEPEKFVSMPEEMRRKQELNTTHYLEKNCKDFALPKDTPKKEESSECEKIRDYLAQLTSKEDLLVHDPQNPEKFIKTDKETRQQKIDEAQTFLKETCLKQQ